MAMGRLNRPALMVYGGTIKAGLRGDQKLDIVSAFQCYGEFLSGAIDVAAIDSNVLSLAEGEMPELSERVRVIESWGPPPIQPMVLSASLHEELGPRLGEALLAMMDDPEAGPALRRFGLERCVSIDDALYADERRALEELGQLRPCVR